MKRQGLQLLDARGRLTQGGALALGAALAVGVLGLAGWVATIAERKKRAEAVQQVAEPMTKAGADLVEAVTQQIQRKE